MDFPRLPVERAGRLHQIHADTRKYFLQLLQSLLADRFAGHLTQIKTLGWRAVHKYDFVLVEQNVKIFHTLAGVITG